MKRSDLKKILMEEALSILSEKTSEEDRCKEIEAMTPQQRSNNMLNDEYRECREKVSLRDRLENMVDNYESGEQPSEETLKSMASVGINPAAIDSKEDLAAAAEKVAAKEPKPTGVAPGERPTKIKPTERPAAAAAEKESEGAIYGLTSKKNPESLLNILSKAGFEAGVIRKVITKMKQLADDDNIMLEAVSLRGRGSEQDRVMNSESVGELISLVRSLGLGADQNRVMMKALNNWGNRNTVRFEKPTFAPAAPEAPQKTAAEPGKEEPRAAGGLTDDPPAYTTADEPAQTSPVDVGEFALDSTRTSTGSPYGMRTFSTDTTSTLDGSTQPDIAYSGLDAFAKQKEEEAVAAVGDMEAERKAALAAALARKKEAIDKYERAPEGDELLSAWNGARDAHRELEKAKEDYEEETSAEAATNFLKDVEADLARMKDVPAAEKDPFDFTDFDEKEAAKEKTAAEEPPMNRDEDIKQTLKKLDRVYSVDDFKKEYLGLLFRTKDWKKLFGDEGEAKSAVNKAIDNIKKKENARDIDMALRSEAEPSSEIVSFFNNIQNFGNQEAMFTSRLLELVLFEHYFDKLASIKEAGDGSKNEKSYSEWKDGPGKIGQWAIEALINQNYANRLARRATPNTPDPENLQEHKTLNRWKILAGIK